MQDEATLDAAWARLRAACAEYNAASEAARAVGLSWDIAPLTGYNATLHPSPSMKFKVSNCYYSARLVEE